MPSRRCASSARRSRTRSGRSTTSPCSAVATHTDPRVEGRYLKSGFIDAFPARPGRRHRRWLRRPIRIAARRCSSSIRRRDRRRRRERHRVPASPSPEQHVRRCVLAAARRRRGALSVTSSRLLGHSRAVHDGYYTNEVSNEDQAVVDANYQGNLARLREIKKQLRPGQPVPPEREHRAGCLSRREDHLSQNSDPYGSRHLAARLALASSCRAAGDALAGFSASASYRRAAVSPGLVEPTRRLLPVRDRPPAFQVLGPPILVLQVVRVFPDVADEKHGLAPCPARTGDPATKGPRAIRLLESATRNAQPEAKCPVATSLNRLRKASTEPKLAWSTSSSLPVGPTCPGGAIRLHSSPWLR